MSAPEPKLPTSTAEARATSWRWVGQLQRGAAVLIEKAATADEGTAYAKADEVVRFLQMQADMARALRDTLQPTTVPEQFHWLKVLLTEGLQAVKDEHSTFKRETPNMITQMAILVSEHLEKRKKG